MKNNIRHTFLSITFILISFCFFSCEKDAEQNDAMDFKFTGAIDTTLAHGENFSRSLKVLYLGGAFERVTFSTSNVPAGVEISYEPSSALVDSSVNQLIKVSANADTGHYTVSVTGTAEGGKTFTKEFDLHIIADFNFKPVILLVGGAGINVTLNAPFIDPGFSASDMEDGDLTSQIRTYGTVNVDSVGIYTLAYAVTDSEGKTDSVIRKVGVLNNLNFLNAQYTCVTTNLQTGAVINWITSLSASVSINNRATIFKFSSLYPVDVYFGYNSSTDSIYIPAQTGKGITPDTLTHTFEGAGKIFHSGPNVHIIIDYTDTYIDTTGTQMIINKRDDYTN